VVNGALVDQTIETPEDDASEDDEDDHNQAGYYEPFSHTNSEEILGN